MSSIEKIGLIAKQQLSDEHYFQSLLEQGQAKKLLSDFQLEQIQSDCLALLAKKTQQFSGGDSSSIRIEKAQSILESTLYTIGVQLKTHRVPEDAIASLQQDGVQCVCARGRGRIGRLVAGAKVRHFALVSHLLQTPNAFYAATIVDGIKGFFKLYDPDFAAQEIHITADYPVYNKTKRLLGIEFIGQYLEQLYYENQFLVYFAAEDIHHLLCGYDERYEQLLFNLYEPVLAAALGCVIANTDASRLEMTPQAQHFLCEFFADKSADTIEEILAGALAKISRSYGFSDGLLAYTRVSLPALSRQIEYAVKMGTINQVFIEPKYLENNPKLVMSYGEKMDDQLYRKVLFQFISSRTMDEKMSIVKNCIDSLGDLNDLLLDAQLTAKEIADLLKGCSPAQIAALLKKYNEQYEMNFTQLRDCEKTLYEGLHLFVSSVPAKQQAMLKKAAEIMEVC